MASDWRISFVLVDRKGVKTTMNFKVHSDDALLVDALAAVNTVMDNLKTDLAAVTEANFYSETLTYLKAGSTTLPNSGDVTDIAQIICYLTAEGVLPKYATLRIPAPVDGIFEANLVDIDKADADLIAYVANFADGIVQISDGEYVVVANQNGIKGGGWASVKKTRTSVSQSVG